MNNLDQLINGVYQEAIKEQPDLCLLKSNLEKLVLHLSGPKGRTDNNCRHVDNAFCLKPNWPACIQHLPKDFYAVLFDIGGTLHDAIAEPEIASSFESLPEQLLERVRALRVIS